MTPFANDGVEARSGGIEVCRVRELHVFAFDVLVRMPCGRRGLRKGLQVEARIFPVRRENLAVSDAQGFQRNVLELLNELPPERVRGPEF
jgi:hypothetical protein